jgi:hypothetical protein
VFVAKSLPGDVSSPEETSSGRLHLPARDMWSQRRARTTLSEPASSRRVNPSALSSSPKAGHHSRHERSPHCLAGTSLDPGPCSRKAPADSYLGHTPPPRRLKHLADEARHRLPAGCRGGSQISGSCRTAAHVARRCYPPGPASYVPASRLGIVSTLCRAISGGRTQKLPLTRRCRRFALRPRLRPCFPASPFGPLVVELFAAGCFSPTPSQSRPGSACHQVGSSPRRPRLNGPRGTFTRIALWASVRTPWRVWLPLQLPRPRLKAEACLCRPRFPGKPSDRTSGLALVPSDAAQRHQREGYSEEPPSNWASPSRGTQLYGPTPWRLVNSAPLAEVVSLGLPGGAAHLDDVNAAPRH